VNNRKTHEQECWDGFKVGAEARSGMNSRRKFFGRYPRAVLWDALTRAFTRFKDNFDVLASDARKPFEEFVVGRSAF
jgi:hypothetical protein